MQFLRLRVDQRLPLLLGQDGEPGSGAKPDFLRSVVPHLLDPLVAYVQTPQSYREWQESSFLQSVYYNFDEYFQTRVPARGESNGIICVGTMAVIRRAAIESVGAWDGASVTEDAELSVRLLANGWKGVFDHRTMGYGLMPLDFNGMRKQRFRWALGMMHIFRMHRKVLFSTRRGEHGLKFLQQMSFWGLANQFLSELVPLACAVSVGLIAGLAALGGDASRMQAMLILPATALFLYIYGEPQSGHFLLPGPPVCDLPSLARWLFRFQFPGLSPKPVCMGSLRKRRCFYERQKHWGIGPGG